MTGLKSFCVSQVLSVIIHEYCSARTNTNMNAQAHYVLTHPRTKRTQTQLLYSHLLACTHAFQIIHTIGVYRGQYKNGVRHGHGTRSSAAYERDPRSTTNVSSASDGTKKISVTSISSDRWSQETSGGSRLSNAVAVTRTETTMSLESSAQIYEGEWKDDKRHGHGVLKVPGHRTYYGQWEENTKTGYGVLLYNDGRKEEGQWQNGKLINTLKRKKALSLRNHNLEGKVKLAHITAIQMSITARSKAELAESRASSASTKFQSAQKCVQQAVKDAQTAREKANMCKNAPRVAGT